MNAFPGFRVLDRAVVPPPARVSGGGDDCDDDDDDGEECIAGKSGDGGGGDDDGGWVMVRNSYTSSSGREVQFVTRESSSDHHHQQPSSQQHRQSREEATKATRPSPSSTMHARVESLLSHRRYGVDNTGNIRVWDAEGTLAGFLLSVILEDDEDGCDEHDAVGGGGPEVADVERMSSTPVDDAGVSRLRKDLRSLLTTRKRRPLPPPSSFAGGGGEEGSPPTTDGALRCNLLELGAGQAGLAGLAVASVAAAADVVVVEHGNDPAVCGTVLVAMIRPMCVVLTDGHPRCVENNAVCAGMVSVPRGGGCGGGGGGSDDDDAPAARVRVEAGSLLWDSGPNGAEACRRINALVEDLRPPPPPPPPPPTTTMDGAAADDDGEKNVEGRWVSGPYHLCLASDCVHFREFHDGLLASVARALAVDGVALLCQPRRGRSLGDFMTLVDAVNAGDGGSPVVGDVVEEVDDSSSSEPLFRMTLYEDFHPKVSEIHRSLLSAMEGDAVTCEGSSLLSCSETYDPNLHLPLLLVLRKLRPYDEDEDGEQARQFVKARNR